MKFLQPSVRIRGLALHQMKTALYSQKRLYSAVFYAFKMLRQRNENIFYALFVSVPAKQTRMA